MRLLLVDENPHTLSSLADFLSANLAGISIITASGIVEAAAHIATAVPDFLITSVFFEDSSEGDGFSLRDAVLERDASVPIAFLSTQALDEFENELRLEDTLFYSPIDGETLLEWVFEKTGMVAPAPGAETPPAETFSSEGLPEIGTQLGDYELLELTAVEERVAIYRALQKRVQREVSLVLLKPELANTKEGVRAFRDRVRAKALINHPHITPVYEAHEQGATVFYTRERAKGQSLGQLAAAGVQMKQEALLQIARETAEAYIVLGKNGDALAPLQDSSLFLSGDGELEIINPAEASPDPAQSQPTDIAALGHALLRLTDPTSLAHAHIGQVAQRMTAATDEEASGETALTTWHAVAEASGQAQEALSEARSLHAPQESAPTAPSPAAQVFLKRQRDKRKRTALIAAAATIAGGIALFLFSRSGAATGSSPASPSTPEELAAFEQVSSSRFIYQEDEERRIPTFWIGRYEVTIGQYYDFLEAVSLAPASFDHPDQPPEKTSHAPAVDLSTASPNLPITNIDWWDALAYANYKNARLPTEEEWEKAARGKLGDLYPWGADPTGGQANLGKTAAKSVTSFPGDTGFYRCHGMAGNVSEWTATQIPHPTIPDVQTAVVRGGSYRTPPETPVLTTRLAAESLEERVPTIGFRIARDSAPE